MQIAPGLLEGVSGSTQYCDPSNWTLVEEWDSVAGDITAIAAELTGVNGFAWSPDGTKLTISSGGSNKIVTFTCSTAFDPDTATETATRGPAGNPACMAFINGGEAYFVIYSVGDDIYRFDSTAYVTSESGAEHSICTKGEVGLGGTTDGSFCAAPDGTWVYWLGDDTSQDERMKYVTFTNADLDSPTVVATSGVLTGELSRFTTDQGMSPPNTTGDKFFYVDSGWGSLITLDNGQGDLSSITQATRVSLNNLLTSWSANSIWVNPNDTTYVWIGGRSNSGTQLAKLQQNCP